MNVSIKKLQGVRFSVAVANIPRRCNYKAHEIIVYRTFISNVKILLHSKFIVAIMILLFETAYISILTTLHTYITNKTRYVNNTETKLKIGVDHDGNSYSGDSNVNLSMFIIIRTYWIILTDCTPATTNSYKGL